MSQTRAHIPTLLLMSWGSLVKLLHVWSSAELFCKVGLPKWHLSRGFYSGVATLQPAP